MSQVNPGALPPPVYSPVVKVPVGNESTEQKAQPLPPVEQPDHGEKLRNRKEGGGRQHDGGQARQGGEETGEEPSTAAAEFPGAGTAPGFRVLPVAADSPAIHSPATGARALDAFRSGDSDPGQLLDQRV
jgi:hypothetical protein